MWINLLTLRFFSSAKRLASAGGGARRPPSALLLALAPTLHPPLPERPLSGTRDELAIICMRERARAFTARKAAEPGRHRVPPSPARALAPVPP